MVFVFPREQWLTLLLCVCLAVKQAPGVLYILPCWPLANKWFAVVDKRLMFYFSVDCHINQRCDEFHATYSTNPNASASRRRFIGKKGAIFVGNLSLDPTSWRQLIICPLNLIHFSVPSHFSGLSVALRMESFLPSLTFIAESQMLRPSVRVILATKVLLLWWRSPHMNLSVKLNWPNLFHLITFFSPALQKWCCVKYFCVYNCCVLILI